MTLLAITGGTGGLGANVIAAAIARGVPVRALVRDPSRAPSRSGVELRRGDATREADVAALIDGATALVHCVNVPFHADWRRAVTQLLDVAMAACASAKTRLVYPGNVWVFGRGVPGQSVSESQAFAPISAKGATRAANEQALVSSGVRHVVVRLPEFYGPHVTTLLGPPLRALARGETARWLGDPDLPVELAYMPDAGGAFVDAGLREGIDGERFHWAGGLRTTGRELLERARTIVGRGRVRAVPAWVVRAAALVSRDARGFADILHLWESPILLDGAKWERTFGRTQRTPLDESLRATFAWLAANPNVKMHY